MDILQQSALAWKELTEYRYQFVYGYKKTLYPINLTFSFEDYPHLASFQYLKDISLPNYTSAKIVDRILEGKITFEQIQKAAQYEEMVKPRLEALIHLKNSLDFSKDLYII
ncbi:PBECR4 domain-containing protein [Mediterraneibacter glycyrrhizinilyticus]|uniref:PBECR4 domain-containing protein n=1 Tax=Mediterraneibacter glycyrrhizinilyticus TaxID=342942 RepID=UPI0025A46D44|nr:PBECR4 domain-containing protein [Mediterraneibacter glycyrrhizinilyticus]MDM8210028.1 PBECR4 domain-containing protein [Mediterraneibacter glycyrrhizinilyticus]